MGVETVFLDAGGVLVHPDWQRISAILAAHGIEIDPVGLGAADHLAKFQIDVDRYIGTSTDRDRFQRYFQLVFAGAGIRPDSRVDGAFDVMREYHDARNLWETVPDDVIPALVRLRTLGLRLVVVSNANGTVANTFARLGLSPYVDLIVDSHHEGVEKPDPRLFQIALERAGARPNSTVHLGDLFHVDVVGARAAGVRAVLLDAADLYADRDCQRVRTLAEFANGLEAELSQQR
jgi:HAD superfamily hydrolase (TIGR01549 family)